ncbi:acetoacetyl-CoA synthetase [Macrolepiota fuliginosa MF-IS2]|uniref:Acetoacetyl-CoA synthetase n=1 Tax=Macrolepiota fuliginosa MF-IS2 TaxID=1400762 RepID=A0A9P6C8B3_9AGAR|nr:acetoacetyl-CoA synthetase [Macrolepiota fuliginosa MF-IS2]
MDLYFSQSKLLWTPRNPEFTNTDLLRRLINRKHGLSLQNYHELHKYSVEHDEFWLDLWEFLGIISSVPPEKERVTVPGRFKEIPTWFPGALLNYAENLLWRKDDAVAITAARETGPIEHYTYRQLRGMVRQMASALRISGLQVGDRVAAIVTNSITAVVVALAVASIGGIFSTTATDMGVQGILDRYRQIQPKFIFADTEVDYAGKQIKLANKIREVAGDLGGTGLQQTILLPSRITGKEVELEDVKNSVTLSRFLQTADDRELQFEQLPFSQPLFILYSSGTSGKPKCIVHSAGGVLLQTKKDIHVNLNLSINETYFQYTTTGWMMWTFMLTGLAIGARVILYDGSPFYPDLRTYLKFIDSQHVTLLGTSPRFLAEIQGRGIQPLQLGRFEGLKSIASTGAVLTPPMFEWAQHAFGDDIHLMSPSGGTDVCTGFLTGAATLPVYCGETQCKALGHKVEVFDPSGNNIEHTGQPGELVCTKPHPSLPLYFWGDHTGEKLREAYFNMYPGIWRQGDFIVVNPKTKGIIILGRSDGVLNPSGVRFGSGEIYAVLERFSSDLDDSLCIGQRRAQDKDERVLLFLKMREGHKFTPQLETQIRNAIRTSLSARHVPSYIFEIEEIPYTVNGKKIEIAVKQIVSGSNLQPSGTVANPESLKLYYKFREIEKMVNLARAKL